MWTRLVFLPVAIGICFPLCCHSQKSDSPLFERLPPSFTGVDFESRIEADHPMARLYHSGFACGGVAIGDIDDDGRPDIYLVNGPGPNRLYRQVDAFRFEDATESPGLDGSDHWGTGATMADIDNDGDLDIYLCNYDAPNQLFLNRGDGTFLEAAAAFGVDVRDASLMPSFCDYDRDGDLDLFITTYRYYREGGLPEVAGHLINGEARVLRDFEKYYTVHNEVRAGRKASRIGTYGRADYLLENDGNGRFTNVTARAGLGGHGLGLAATWWDYNSDGWPDLYLSNDFADPDRLYRNNRDGTFTDVLLESVPHTPWFSMGADSADLNNDGLPDLLAADMSATTHFMEKTTMGAMNAAKLASVAGPPPQYMRNALYLNTGTGRFLEAAYLAGLADSDWSWAVKLADLDNDGRVDAFISNGMTRNFNNSDMPANSSMLIGRTQWDLYRDTPTRPERNLAFRNDGNLHFSETGKNWGLDHLGMSFGAALADLDSDGDLDLVVTNLDEPVGIYRNHSSSNWIAFQLIGNKSNSKGIGATVRLYSGSTSQYRRLQPVTGMLSSNQPIVHFGLGNATDPCSITINWPSGAIQKIEDLAANIYHRIEEKDDSPLPDETLSNEEKPSTPLYLAHSALANQHHRECLDFDDFAQQPLLPNRLSLLGPGMAWDDIDRDGDYDVFLSGAAGQPGRLLRNNGDGDFCLIETPCLVEDLHHEDMGAVFFDADSDGDSDLYVVSGGVEHPVGSPALRDRLYLNAGDGSFSRSGPHALPDIRDSGSVVAAADYDRDGDLDLFIGGRVIPGRYPLAPRSRLLRNDSGIFHDTTESSPQLSVAGMVTSATWSDTDSDGWIDLLLTLEWGPVKWFRNENGRLVDRSSQAGLENRSGWWNGIAAADLDGDSDIDYVVTNFGLNTKYHASPEKPALLYYGDFDGRGRMRLVEAEYEHQNLFPIRGRSCSTHAMPFLADKFKSYREFALADLGSIYPPQRLNSAHRFAASTLESGVLLNDGKGVLSFLPLPRLAQIAPSFGVAIFNADDDPHPDLFLAQNFFGPQPETGRMDGGLGLLLAGNGDGTFLPLWPAQSGIVSPDDGRSLATIDLNADGWLDLAIGNNNGRANCFVRRSGAESRPITVRLTGNPGNPSGVGARVTVCFQDGTIRSAEIYAGGGYLSQCPPLVTFATGGSEVDSIEIRWPDGRQSLQQGRKGAFVYEIAYATASLQLR
jgi:hypothetical protein